MDIIIIEKSEDGKIHLTVDEFKGYMNQAYNAGKNSLVTIHSPVVPYDPITWTCDTHQTADPKVVTYANATRDVPVKL